MQDNGCSAEIIKDMVRNAASLYNGYAEPLSQDPEFLNLLDQYARALKESSDKMRSFGVVSACTICATKESGSCCFPGIEKGYDEVLLFINLLLGCSLPDEKEVANSCFFVGGNGCKLVARYYFCVHYLCPMIQGELGVDRVRSLLSVVGEELHAGWQVEKFLRRRLKQIGTVDRGGRVVLR